MNYIEEVLSDIKTLESARTPKDSYLRIQSEEDISPEALLKAESITFSHDYAGPDINSILPGIINGAPNLKKLSLNMDDCEADLSSLDLKGIEQFSIHADKDNSFVAVDMPQLFDLTIHFDPELDAPCMVDLSRAPFIKSLSLLDTKGLDFSCLEDLKSLKKLHVRGVDITDLDWLNNVKSNLASLTIEGKIIDCEGIANQPELEDLCLCHHVMLDVTPIEGLDHLKKLMDLRKGDRKMAYYANVPKSRRFTEREQVYTCDKNSLKDYRMNQEGLPDNKSPIIQYLSSEAIFYSIEDVMKLTGWSRKVVQGLFNIKDFPCSNIGKRKIVEAHALIAYFAVKRPRSDEGD